MASPAPSARPRLAVAEPKAPPHLKAATRRWWSEVVDTYALEPHHLKLLALHGMGAHRS
jgi:hypothetical protein